MMETFGSSCHGAGRTMSRHESVRRCRGFDLHAEMGKYGVTVRSHGIRTIAEEMPHAYKDVTMSCR